DAHYTGDLRDLDRDDPAVLIGLAALRRGADDPAIENVAVVLEAGRPGTGRHDDVVDGDALALDEAVTRVRDRDLDLARSPAGVGQRDRPVLPATGCAAGRVPRAGRSGGGAAQEVVLGISRITRIGDERRHVVLVERV